MNKRVLSVICSLLVLCCMVLSISVNVNAERTDSADIMVDGSLQTYDDCSTGTSFNSMTRGKHLMEGESGISKVGSGRIYVYGQTTADHIVDFVAVLMYVEKLDESDGLWGAYADYTVDARDKYYVIVDDTLAVDKGYYYRVHCEHIAGNEDDRPYDTAVSATNGIWIP